MLEAVPVPERRLASYSKVAGEEDLNYLRRASEPLRGARLLHVNSTAYGGGVAELLVTQVALLRDLGLEAEWRVVGGSPFFFQTTKTIHNALQGKAVNWKPEMAAAYWERSFAEAEALRDTFDFVVVHDPQPAGILAALVRTKGKRPPGRWIWRCHVDTSAPDPTVWSFLRPLVECYDAVVFTLPRFIPPDLSSPRTAVIPPSIDPLSPKNVPIDPSLKTALVRRFGLDPNRPLLLQVSRFDPWKDPVGVIRAFRLIKEDVPDAVLALVGALAHDDPEAHAVLREVEGERAGDPDILVLTNLQGVGHVEVNAFQRHARVVLQKSIKEGFGLTVSEALWKGRPVVGGNVGGIRIQIQDGVTGYLVSSVEECAARAVELLKDEETAREMGRKGREHVRRNFLTLRELGQFLDLLLALAEEAI